MMKQEALQKLFQDIGHIKATQMSILDLQKRLEKDFTHHEQRLRFLERKVTRIFAFASALITIVSAIFAFFTKYNFI